MDIKLLKEAQQFNPERFTKIDVIKNRKNVVFVLNFLPGQEMKAHGHPNKELFLHILEGSGFFTIDGDEVAVTKGDIIQINEEEKLGFVNSGGQKVSIYCVMTKLS